MKTDNTPNLSEKDIIDSAFTDLLQSSVEKSLSQKKEYDKYFSECKSRLDKIAKPLDGLGEFESVLCKIAGASQNANISLKKKGLIVMCADNGVVRNNISQSDSSTTLNIVRSLVKGTSSVNLMADKTKTDTFIVDIGLNQKVDGTINRAVKRGTNDILTGPAMTYDEAVSAIQVGIDMVKELTGKGYNIIATGEAGIGNTTTSSALCSVLTKLPVKDVTGRGAGLDDKRLSNKIRVIEESIRINNLNDYDINHPSRVISLISRIGGFDIAGITGIFLAAPLYKVPIVMDGVISCVGALLACKINPIVNDYIIPSHMSNEIAMKSMCEMMNLHPILDGKLHIGEGTGAVLMLSLLDVVLNVYKNAAHFNDIEVEQYVR